MPTLTFKKQYRLAPRSSKNRKISKKKRKKRLPAEKKRIFAAVIKTWMAASTAKKAKPSLRGSANAATLTEANKKSSRKGAFFYALITVMQYCTFSLPFPFFTPTRSSTLPIPGKSHSMRIIFTKPF